MDEALVVVGGLTLVFLVPLPLPHVLHDVCVQRDMEHFKAKLRQSVSRLESSLSYLKVARADS